MKKKLLLKIALTLGLVNFAHNIANSQEMETKVHEVGIGFNSTSSFSLRYQWGTDQMVYRISVISLGVTNSDSKQTDAITATNTNPSTIIYSPLANTPINLSGGLNLSLAKMKSINEKFGFMYGTVLGINSSYLKTKTEYDYLYTPQQNVLNSNYTTESISSSYAPFIGLLIGARYKISSSFYLYAEISPNINYTYAKATSTTTAGAYTPPNSNKVTNTYGISGLANSGALITIVYRILK